MTASVLPDDSNVDEHSRCRNRQIGDDPGTRPLRELIRACVAMSELTPLQVGYDKPCLMRGRTTRIADRDHRLP